MTRRRVLRAAAAHLIAVLCVVGVAGTAWAQDGSGGPGAGTDAGQELPKPHIIPRANSGSEPVDAGDRGGPLQIAVLGVVVVALSGGTALVVREARRARPAGD